MSVYKSKRGESSVQFIETARQLEAHTFACCMKAPKRYERFLTGRIMELSSEVHDRVRAANNIWPTNRHEAQLRRDELMRANNALQNLSPKLQLLYDSILQNPEGYGWIHKAMQRWGDLICEEAKLIAAVKKNDGSGTKTFRNEEHGSSSEFVALAAARTTGGSALRMAATPRISAMSTATATPTTTTRAMRMAWPSDSARDGSGQ